jgi:hypothetical protein
MNLRVAGVVAAMAAMALAFWFAVSAYANSRLRAARPKPVERTAETTINQTKTMNVLFLKETVRRGKQPPLDTVLIVEDNGTEDGGRIIAKVTRYSDAVDIVKAMWWKITFNEFEP